PPDRADRDRALRVGRAAHRLRARTPAAARPPDHRAARAGADHPAGHRAGDRVGLDVHPPRTVAHRGRGRPGTDRRFAALHDPDCGRHLRGGAPRPDRCRPEPRGQPLAAGPRRPDPPGAARAVCRRAVHVHRQPGGVRLDLHRLHAVRADLARPAVGVFRGPAVPRARDGHVGVMHDRSVARRTNGSGFVADLTRAELQALDAGAWFDRKFAGERVPTLAGVLNWSGGRLGFLIELKNYPRREMPLVERTIAEIEAHRAQDYVVPAGFDHVTLAEIHRLRPAWPLEMIVIAR